MESLFLDSIEKVQSFLHFIFYMDSEHFLKYFWSFLVFDLPRYVLLDFLVIFAYLPLRRRRARRYAIARKQLFRERPLVSVLVPGKNEGKHLTALAESLRGQTYSKLELIVVDDGSDDDTEIIGRRLKRKGLIRHFIRNEERGGKASAANTALAYAKGRFIVHLDADLHLNPDSIERILIPFFLEPAIGMVGGDIRVRNASDSITTRLQAIEYMKGISVGRTIASMLGMLRIVAGAFGAFRADVLRELKGWDVGPGLDGDITLKFRKLGWRVHHEPYAVCYTQVPDTPIKLAKQRLRWDRSVVRFRARKHVDMLKFDRNFRVTDFVTVAENLYSNIFLNLLWWVYIVQITVFQAPLFPRIIMVNYLLYLLANIVAYAIAIVLLKDTVRRDDFHLIWFLPLMPFYVGFFIRVVRTYAYVTEFLHGASYQDPWNPWKVSRIARREGM